MGWCCRVRWDELGRRVLGSRARLVSIGMGDGEEVTWGADIRGSRGWRWVSRVIAYIVVNGDWVGHVRQRVGE